MELTPLFRDLEGWSAVKSFFDLDEVQAVKLFAEHSHELTECEAAARAVAARIRKMIASLDGSIQEPQERWACYFSKQRNWTGSNRADADETSGGLYQEINGTGVALKNLNLSPPRRQAVKAAEGGDQHVIRRTIYSEPKHLRAARWWCLFRI
jgi:hypothetical protein